jgi:hypothetical protein
MHQRAEEEDVVLAGRGLGNESGMGRCARGGLASTVIGGLPGLTGTRVGGCACQSIGLL